MLDQDSNSFASFSSTAQDFLEVGEYDSLTNYAEYITPETIHSFNAGDLPETLIGRLSSDSQLTCVSDFGLSTSSEDFSWERLTNNLFALEIGPSDESHSLISELLDSNHFDYFEIDQTWTIA